MRCMVTSVTYNEIGIEDNYGDVLCQYDFEIVTKTVAENKYETTTRISHAQIIVDDMEQLKALTEDLKEDIIITINDNMHGCDLILKIYDGCLE